MQQAGTIKGFVILTFEFHKDGRYWEGQCRELGTAVNGRSFDKVKDHLIKLVILHLNGLEAIGERENVFKERGIRLYTDELPVAIITELSVDDDATLVQAAKVPVSV